MTYTDAKVHVWRTSEIAPLYTLNVGPAYASGAFLVPGDETLVTTDHNGDIRAWDLRTGGAGNRFQTGSPIVAAAISPDGKYLLACHDNWASLHNLGNGVVVRRFYHAITSNFDGYQNAAFSADGSQILTSTIKSIRLWSTWGGFSELKISQIGHYINPRWRRNSKGGCYRE